MALLTVNPKWDLLIVVQMALLCSAYSESTVESIRLGGCPRGSTAAYSLELRKKVEAATKKCVSLLSDLQREMKPEGRRLRKGEIKDTISQCAARHNLPPSVEIKTETVKQRLKRKTTKGITDYWK
jgi:hypothetical protein